MDENKHRSDWPGCWYQVARGVAVVAGLFALVVAVLMVADYYQLRTVDPLNSPALTALRAAQNASPESVELREQVRALDLMARKAYFTRQWQLRTGTYLLLGAAILAVAALQVMVLTKRRMPRPSACPGLGDKWSAATTARIWIAWGGIGLLAVGLILGVDPHDRFKTELGDRPQAQKPPKMAPEQGSGPALDPYAAAGAGADKLVWPGLGFPAEFGRNWPSFRGLGGNAQTQRPDMPLHWDGTTGEGVLWKTAVPLPGMNSPVVWEQHIFLTGADDSKLEVYCLDADSGALKWTHAVTNIPGSPADWPEVTPDTGYSAPSVATDGNRVYAMFATGDLVCLDFAGNRVWARNLGVPENHYGHSSSLLIYRNLLYVQFDHFGGAELKALDTATGKGVWEKVRAADISWASPILVETAGRMQLVLTSTPLVNAYDPMTGEELWSTDCMSGEVGPSPAYHTGRVFAANQYASAVGLDAKTGEILWQVTEPELPDATSPVATAEYLFMGSSYGTFTCLDATDGSTIWTHDFDTGSYASPVLVNDLIYLTDMDGVTHILKAAGKYESVAQAPLGEGSVATPAFVGSRIYIRGNKHLYCIGVK